MPETFENSTIRSVIQNASGHAQATVIKSERTALAVVDRVADAAQSTVSGLKDVRVFGAELTAAVDAASRATVSGLSAVGSSLMAYGKDVASDTADLGRRTLATRSLTDALALHVAFVERRIDAAFKAMASVNAMTHDNVLAFWRPFASLVPSTTVAIPGTQTPTA